MWWGCSYPHCLLSPNQLSWLWVTASLYSAMSSCSLSSWCESDSRGCAWRGVRSSRLQNRKCWECGWRAARCWPGPGWASGRHQGLAMAGGLSAPCSSWGCIQGNPTSLWQGVQVRDWPLAGVEQGWRIVPLRQGERSRVTGAFTLGCVGGNGTCCPSCSGEGWELPDVITSFSSSLTSLCTYHYDDLFCWCISRN